MNIFTENHRLDGGYNGPCAYIEPSGATPDGLFFPLPLVKSLLTRGVIVEHAYDDREVDGIAFDIYGETESRDESRNFNTIITESFNYGRFNR